MKHLYATLGVIAVALGVLGMFVPGLPTVPFLLLASHLFYNSSARLHRWVRNHKILGAHISRYEERGGMSRRSKLSAIGLTVVMSLISILCFVSLLWVKWTISLFALTGVIVIWFFVKTVDD